MGVICRDQIAARAATQWWLAMGVTGFVGGRSPVRTPVKTCVSHPSVFEELAEERRIGNERIWLRKHDQLKQDITLTEPHRTEDKLKHTHSATTP